MNIAAKVKLTQDIRTLLTDSEATIGDTIDIVGAIIGLAHRGSPDGFLALSCGRILERASFAVSLDASGLADVVMDEYTRITRDAKAKATAPVSPTSES